MPDVHDRKTFSSWLIYYLGNKNEDEFVSTAVKLGYPMLTKKIDNILVAILQESNDSKKSQRIILRYLSFFFGSRLVVSEYCTDELGQNHLPPPYVIFISDRKNIYFWIKPISKFLTTLLEGLYYQEYFNKSESNSISTIDIVVGGDHSKGTF